MRLLIDENLPKILKQHLPDHEAFTVRDMGWWPLLPQLQKALANPLPAGATVIAKE